MGKKTVLAVKQSRSQIDKFKEICKKSGISYSSAINIAVHRIANGEKDAFVIEPVIKDVDDLVTKGAAVDAEAYAICKDACEELGVTPRVLVTTYVARCVRENRILF